MRESRPLVESTIVAVMIAHGRDDSDIYAAEAVFESIIQADRAEIVVAADDWDPRPIVVQIAEMIVMRLGLGMDVDPVEPCHYSDRGWIAANAAADAAADDGPYGRIS